MINTKDLYNKYLGLLSGAKNTLSSLGKSYGDYRKQQIQKLNAPIDQSSWLYKPGKVIVETSNKASRLMDTATQGFTGGMTWGLGKLPNIESPKTLPEKLTYGAGYGVGLFNPLNPVTKLAGVLKPTFSSIQKPLGTVAGKLIAKGGIGKLAGRGIANVAQGLPYGAAYGLAKTVTGEPYTGKQALGDVGIDLAVGSLPLVGGLVIGAKGAGFKNLPQFEGMDKKVKAEISDLVARIKPKTLQLMEVNGGTARLGHLFEHAGLYKNYPELKNLRVDFNIEGANPGKLGSFNPETFNISIDSRQKPEQMRSTLLHEIQHVVQEIEGFSKGGSPTNFGNVFDSINKRLFELSKQDLNNNPTLRAEYDNLLAKKQNTPFETYQRIYGEIEAAAVQARSNMTSQQRKLESFEETVKKIIKERGISPEDVLFNTRGGTVVGSATKAGMYDTPKTAKVWIKSKFSNDGAYADMPIIRKEQNIKLYQGGSEEGRQFWTPDKKYAEQFGKVTEKTGDFYQIDNGNRMTKVYVEAKPNVSQPPVQGQAGLYDTKAIPSKLLHFTDKKNVSSISEGGLRFAPKSESSISEGISLATKRTEMNEIFGNAEVPVYVKPGVKSITLKEAIDKMGFGSETDLGAIKNIETKAPEWAMKNGYDILDMRDARGAIYKGMDEIRVLNPDVVSTKPFSNVAQQPLSVTKGVGEMGQITKPPTSLEGQIVSQKSTALENVGQPQTKISSEKPLIETQTPVTGQKKLISSQTVADGSFKYNIADKLYTESVNRFHPLSKLAKVAGKDAELNRKIAGFYGTGSTADYHLSYELSPILKSQNPEDLRSAMVAMRDVELSSRKIQGSPLQKDATKILDELKVKYGEDGMKKMGDSLNQLYAYQDKIAKQYLVDTGIMSQEAYNKMRMDNNFYVPFKRVMDEVDTFLGIPVKKGAGSVGSQNVIYKIKGSNKEIVDPIQSIVENTYKMVSLGKRQEVAQTIASMSKEMPELVHKTNMTGMKDTISVFENGKKVNYIVPQEVAEAARGMGEESLVTLVKILKIPTDLFRTMTTGINPEFLAPNVSRDIQSAIFNTGVNPLKWIAGLAHYVKKDAIFQDFLKSGAKTSRVSLNRPFIEQTAQELAGKGFRIKSPKDIVRGLEMLSQYSEQPTRLMVFEDAYKTAIKKGLSVEDALGDAAYWAQEGTVNFARRGSKTPNINAIYAYLNARMQGIDRMIRTAKSEPLKAAGRYAVAFLAPSLALYAWNSKNPDYYNERILSKRDKQDNFIFMLPKPVGEIRYLKIPKAEVGKIANPVEEFLDVARNKGGDVWSSMMSVLKSFSPIDNWGGVIPTAINPLVETAFNKDFYTGYDLVPEYKKNYPAGYQDSSYTGPMYRFAGQKLNVSPAKLQNLVEGYGGGAMRIADNIVGKMLPDKYTSAKNQQGADINRTPVLRRFMGGEKKSEAEQMKANESRINAIDFDINDIKGGVKRGDIPMDVGVKKIEELQKRQADLMTGFSQAQIKTTPSGQNLQWIQTKEGALKQIDFNFVAPQLKLTGNEILDKEIRSDYNGSLTKLKNDIMTALDAGKITEDEAIKQLTKLTKLKASGPKKGKKFTIKKVKIPKIKLAKVKKIKVAKMKKMKKYTLKVKKLKTAKIKLSAKLT